MVDAGGLGRSVTESCIRELSYFQPNEICIICIRVGEAAPTDMYP